MNIEEIERFLAKGDAPDVHCIKINFKKREPVYGLFIKDNDYSYLKSKNFWRIVTRNHMDQYQKTKDISLARIFNGSEFSRLVPYKESFEE
jgi:hypothetical protein